MTRAALFALLAEAGPYKPTPMTIEQLGCCDHLEARP
jgi:hypothetical protein